MKQLSVLIRQVMPVSLAILITTYLIFQLLSPYARNKSSYVAASLDKELSLATVKSPRLVFVGGSNLALGVDCAKISDELNCRIVNMGLHAGLGLNFILNESIMNIRPGDIVILSIEHFLGTGNIKLMAQLVDVNPATMSIMELSLLDRIRLTVSQLQLCVSSTFYKLIKRDIDPIYNRYAFNSYGDLTAHYGQLKPSSIGGNVRFLDTDYKDGISKINAFIESARAKGAIVYFTFPAFPTTAYQANFLALEKLSAEYKHNLKCPILGDIRTCVMPDQYFYDTVYHLDSTGIQKRTTRIIDLLKKAKIEAQIENFEMKKL